MKRAQLWLIVGAAVFIVLGCFTIFLLGPGRPPEQSTSIPQQEIVVGFSQSGDESSWRTAHTRSIQEAAKLKDIRLLFENAQQKQEKQIDAIRSFIAYKVDVIAFTPIVATGWDHVLEEARSAGIPVILSDRWIETDQKDLYAAYVGTDVVGEGRAAGEFLVKKFQDMGRVRVAEITGTIGSTSSTLRQNGFYEAISGHDNLEIVYSESGDFMRSKGKEAAGAALRLHPDLDVLVCYNDSMALGAIEVLEALGKRPGQDIAIVSFDGERAAMDALAQGKINCIVESTPLLGSTIMDCALALARGETYEKACYLPTRVFTEWDDKASLQSWESN